MNTPKIKVGFCVAYDWELLKNSIPRIYNDADEICLSIDKDRTSWSGRKYEFDEKAFLNFVEAIDKQNKIKIYEDVFYNAGKSPIENDNYQRNKMAVFMGDGGWHIQIDSDEYFIDFKGFVEYLKTINLNKKAFNICVNYISLIKKVENGYLCTLNNNERYEYMPMATNVPEYSNARRNGHFNIQSPFFAIHETWARSDDELWNKMNSWGHSKDFNKESYYKLWQSLDADNAKYIQNFHPIEAPVWQLLQFVKANNVGDVINYFIENKPQLNTKKMFINNNRFIQRIKSIIK
jgi:hypothetical protein